VTMSPKIPKIANIPRNAPKNTKMTLKKIQ
jgi:hypothetical protein